MRQLDDVPACLISNNAVYLSPPANGFTSQSGNARCKGTELQQYIFAVPLQVIAAGFEHAALSTCIGDQCFSPLVPTPP